MLTGNCTDNGCTSQWGNHGSCVDFSNTVDFKHLGATFNLSSGAKAGFCGHNSNGKKDCCHCLNTYINWNGDCVEFSRGILSGWHDISYSNSRESGSASLRSSDTPACRTGRAAGAETRVLLKMTSDQERNATYLVPATLIRCAEQSQK